MKVFDGQYLQVKADGFTMTYGPPDELMWFHGEAKMLAALQDLTAGACRHRAVLKHGSPYVAIIECDSDQEARDLSDLACAETVGGCQ